MSFEPRTETSGRESCAAVLVVVMTVLILLVTLFPFSFHFTPEALDHGRLLNPESVEAEAARAPADFVRNCLLFIPLGLGLLGLGAGRRGRLSTVLLVGTASLVLSALIELLQTGLPSRTPTTTDVVANTLGGLLGAGIGLVWPDLLRRLAHLARMILDLLARRWVLLTLLTVHLGLIWFLTASMVHNSSLVNWSPDFHLILGNEATGDRPWRGNLAEVHLVAAGEELFGLDNATGAVLEPDGTTAVPLAWQGRQPANTSATDGVCLGDGHWLRSVVPVQALNEAVRQAGQFDLVVAVVPADTLQTGPARIFSLSSDPMHRNLTLGQAGGSLVVRLRTPFSGDNGDRPALVVDDVFRPGQLRRLQVQYQGRRLVVRDEESRVLGRLELGYGAAVCRGPIRFNYHDQYGYILIWYGFLLLPLAALAALWRWGSP